MAKVMEHQRHLVLSHNNTYTKQKVQGKTLLINEMVPYLKVPTVISKAKRIRHRKASGSIWLIELRKEKLMFSRSKISL